MGISNCAIIILGASGDLARRKLIPALHELYNQGKIDDTSIIVGSGRTYFDDEKFRQRFEVNQSFARMMYYHQYIAGVKKFVQSKGNFSKVIIFLSQPPSAYGPTARELVAEGFGNEVSLVIEKPFGYDYRSARELNRELNACFSENQIFRIDHYLAKEAVQNILVFRFANSIFFPVWNSHYIEFIQINALENQGIVERGGYFDKSGIIRDMVQNHLLQLLCLLTMEAPVSLDAEDIRNQKKNILRSITITGCNRFQYEGYRQEKAVARDSQTETFAELSLKINNFRWKNTPIYIRTGKALHRQGTEIGIRFRPIPNLLYNTSGDLKQNQIVFKIQPSEGIIIDLSAKTPGAEGSISGTHMNFCYRDSFPSKIPEAYQRLLYDVLKEDHTLFVSASETEIAWSLIDGYLNNGELRYYKPGSTPPGLFNVDWIDFDSYTRLCS
ncbi:Glucose-6-phosphate 1-dehydrogenase [Chitinispirillum alkaliphilum]|nr:Glucose-6-phosphate 1-dehydrogenase [Chitinispirillum alkaliphilum]